MSAFEEWPNRFPFALPILMNDAAETRLPLSVVLPTYGRDKVLTDTVAQLLAQEPAAAEILIVDQTPSHDAETTMLLQDWHDRHKIRWVRLSKPSQPAALNHALTLATQPIVLFLDDDIAVDPGFVAAHVAAYVSPEIWAVAGQVLQPGETELADHVHRPISGTLADLDFPFRSANSASIANGMSGNLSVRRERALELGGFDENFLAPVSYRFDADFCQRLVAAGGVIRFEPQARIHHLRAARGGTRTEGSHMTSASPLHGLGDYYFALRQGGTAFAWRRFLTRPLREVRTRFHLRRPWWIPVKILGELRAMRLALRLNRAGPKLLTSASLARDLCALDHDHSPLASRADGSD